MIIKRDIQAIIESHLFKGKIIIVYGARQTGKTTLLKEIQKKYYERSAFYNCDEPDIKEMFANKSSTELKNVIGSNKVIFIDEAQRVGNIGISLKLLIDNYPEIQIIATGSSSFELSNSIVEPLTGRKYEFHLYPFSVEELTQKYDALEISRILEERIIFGMYPEIVKNSNEAANLLKEISQSYLYKDILQFQNIKHSEALEKLLKALALQIGNEVSYNELSGITGIDKKTVENYIQLLEKAFIIFRLTPYSRNLRNELKKLRKIYFYDTGIRNALINNLNPLSLRQDIGGLWENFIISERVKFNSNNFLNKNIYFWRSHQKQEIDYIEEYSGKLFCYEIKWNKSKVYIPKNFNEVYPESTFNVVSKNNFKDFLIQK